MRSHKTLYSSSISSRNVCFCLLLNSFTGYVVTNFSSLYGNIVMNMDMIITI